MALKMRTFNVFLCLTLMLIQEWRVSANSATTRTQSSLIQTSDPISISKSNRDPSGSSVLGSMYRKSRQLRCVRCYEDRNGYDDRYRSGYSSRNTDDRNWYYPSYDNDRNYSPPNYRDRDDRYSSRTYDRYDQRGYGDRYGGDRYGDRYGGDRYGDRYSSERYGDRYADRDRYDDRRGDTYRGRYEDSYRDRYQERYRDRGGDRDYYDRYHSRYDFGNYRPWDETYRGQSGFDSSGRGYYFAGDEDNRNGNNRRYLPETGGRRCGALVANCPYDRNEGSVQQSSPRPLDYNNRETNSNQSTGWNYMNEQDNTQHSNRGGGGGSVSNGSMENRDRDRDRDSDRDQNRSQQSSSYGGRPPRPIGGSYLFDRDSNDVNTDNQGNRNNAQTATEARNNDAMNQEQPRDGEETNSSTDGPQARMLTGANENKQS